MEREHTLSVNTLEQHLHWVLTLWAGCPVDGERDHPAACNQPASHFASPQCKKRCKKLQTNFQRMTRWQVTRALETELFSNFKRIQPPKLKSFPERVHAKTLLRQTMQKTIDFKVKYLCQDIDTDDKKQTISSDSGMQTLCVTYCQLFGWCPTQSSSESRDKQIQTPSLRRTFAQKGKS